MSGNPPTSLAQLLLEFGHVKVENQSLEQIIESSRYVSLISKPFPGQGFERIYKDKQVSLYRKGSHLKLYRRSPTVCLVM